MIGLGTQDSLGQAQDFVNDYNLTIEMLWDPTFQTWAEFGISSQPAAVLVDRSGDVIKTWRGAIRESEVLSLAASAG